MNVDVCMVITTFPDAETTRRITEALLEARLAGCVQTMPVSSSYRWQGAIHNDQETLAMIKSTLGCYPELEALISKLHPYECPEILCFPAASGLPGYLSWLRQECPSV
jgi:periplasmic divalent cation tolerance protein